MPAVRHWVAVTVGALVVIVGCDGESRTAPTTATTTTAGTTSTTTTTTSATTTTTAAPTAHPLLGVTVCPGTADQPDVDHLAVAYRAAYDDAIVPSPIGTLSHAGFSTLQFGAFRRGADGRWRRLAAPVPLTGAAMASDCGPFRPHS